MDRTIIKIGICLLPTLGIACGAESQSVADPWSTALAEPDATGPLQALDHDLVPGSSGAEVVALHTCLARFGYLPNLELQRDYPRWRPMVATRPASISVYDGRSEEAVKKLQASYDLPVTGIVDDKTREMLRTARCGVPDGIEPLSLDEKFSIAAKYWTDNYVDWYHEGSGDAVLRVRDALDLWNSVTSLTLAQLTQNGNPRIRIKSGPLGAGITGQAYPPNWPTVGDVITMNSALDWYYGASLPIPPYKYDYYAIVIHEVGHALGLDHSSIGVGTAIDPMMHGNGPVKRTLQLDDQVAISALYDVWTQVDTDTKDVGVGQTNGEVWAIAASNSSVRKRNPTNGSWNSAGGIASRIAVGPNGWPYVIAGWGDGTIWYYNSATPGAGIWQEVPGHGCAIDIGVGTGNYGTNAIWAIGCDSSGDATIWKYGNGYWVQDQSYGWAHRIAVDAQGHPWVVTMSGAVYRYTTADPLTGQWEQITSAPQTADIGVNDPHYPWITTPSGGIFVWERQDYFDDGSTPPAPYKNSWRQLAGWAHQLSVGPNSEPWVLDSSQRLYKTIK